MLEDIMQVCVKQSIRYNEIIILYHMNTSRNDRIMVQVCNWS